jgi:hypothetical protein
VNFSIAFSSFNALPRLFQDITSVLGDDSMSSRTSKDDDIEGENSKKQTESLFYKDSSLFLKVIFGV